MSHTTTLPDPAALVPEDFVFPGTEQLDPSLVFSTPGYQAPIPRTDGAAVAALICTVLSPIPLMGLAAAVLGWIALRRLRTNYSTGQSLAWLAVVVGTATSVSWLWALWLFAH